MKVSNQIGTLKHLILGNRGYFFLSIFIVPCNFVSCWPKKKSIKINSKSLWNVLENIRDYGTQNRSWDCYQSTRLKIGWDRTTGYYLIEIIPTACWHCTLLHVRLSIRISSLFCFFLFYNCIQAFELNVYLCLVNV